MYAGFLQEPEMFFKMHKKKTLNFIFRSCTFLLFIYIYIYIKQELGAPPSCQLMIFFARSSIQHIKYSLNIIFSYGIFLRNNHPSFQKLVLDQFLRSMPLCMQYLFWNTNIKCMFLIPYLVQLIKLKTKIVLFCIFNCKTLVPSTTKRMCKKQFHRT